MQLTSGITPTSADLLAQVTVNTAEISVTDSIMANWQQTLDLLSQLVATPAVLIMRVASADIRVLVTSHSEGNPYKAQDTESLGHGLYCETVINTQQELQVKNALNEPAWRNNPDIKLGMIAYCGLPLSWPDGSPFGTLCMLDNRERDYGLVFRQLLQRFQQAINTNLADLYQQARLKHLNQLLEQQVYERTKALTKLNQKLLLEVERRRSVEQSAKSGLLFDSLTGLPNRAYFIDQLSKNLCLDGASTTSVLYLALKKFRSVNDTYGYHAGDRVLQHFSLRLKQQLAQPVIVARMSGAEFVIALTHDCQSDKVMTLINQVLAVCHQPFIIDDRSITISPCLGIAQAPSDASDAVTLIQKASAAMGLSKADDSSYSFFNQHTQSALEQRYQLESHLIDALAKNEFSLHYQPLICLQSRKIVGAEALLRWYNPLLGQVAPDKFIHLAEQIGQIIDIGNFVLHTAIAQAAKWQQRSESVFRIAINISPIQFKDAYFPQYIASLLTLYNLPPSALELEITEGILLHDERCAQAAIEQLQQLGVAISLDDFGTGYSSLSYLQKYRFNTLKIDRCFIANLAHNQQNQELTKAIIAMGKKLNLRVIAEGVESELQHQFIQQEECDFGQGYLYGKPVAAAEFEQQYFCEQWQS